MKTPHHYSRSRLRDGFDDDQPSGVPVRAAPAKADPAKAAPMLDVADLHQLTGCGRLAVMSNGDTVPPPDRHGSGLAGQHPSRRGDRLYWPCGRITDLHGNAIETADVQRASLPLSVSNQGYWERMRGRP